MPYPRPVLRLPLLPFAVLSLLVAAPAAVADEGWSLTPVTGGADGRPYVYAEGGPGTVLEDAVSVFNPGGKPLTVRLGGADADAGFTVRSESADTGAWIGFARTTDGRRTAAHTVTVTVPARTRADVPFTVTVPVGAAPGDHPGAIVASADGRSSAVRVQLRVSGTALSALTVEHLAVRGGGISYELVNRGTTVLTPTLAVRADGVFGRVLDRAPRTLPLRLPPGHRVRLTEPWPRRPALDAVDVRLTVTAAGGAHGSAAVQAGFVPWGPVARAGAGLFTAAGAAVAVRRRRRRPSVRGTGDRTPAEAELTGAVL
ncbi:hypothetical protein AAW14_15050 [Streptomyces hygroscopicus]|uniref:COG1470 family protein n=1 Tax=Streptomyces hygroscopicus TaxID=1912 RepID=UPI00224069B8|nr:hypothetical protein [Streptomyces hygroscopicus]MCW7943328.1 hypothetical protein [Streptomyces hygroscopicus]